MVENIKRSLSGERKGIQRPGKIENVKKSIHVIERKVLWRGIGDFVWTSAGRRERFVAATRHSVEEK